MQIGGILGIEGSSSVQIGGLLGGEEAGTSVQIEGPIPASRPKWVPNGPYVGTHLGPNWGSQLGPTSECPPRPNVAQMGLEWVSSGIYVGLIWDLSGRYLGPTQGSSGLSSWDPHRNVRLDQIGPRWVRHVLYLGYLCDGLIWVYSGHCWV